MPGTEIRASGRAGAAPECGVCYVTSCFSAGGWVLSWLKSPEKLFTCRIPHPDHSISTGHSSNWEQATRTKYHHHWNKPRTSDPWIEGARLFSGQSASVLVTGLWMLKTCLSCSVFSPGDQEACGSRRANTEPAEVVVCGESPHLSGYLRPFPFFLFSESSPFPIALSYFRMSLKGISRSWLGLCGVHRIISLRTRLVMGFC